MILNRFTSYSDIKARTKLGGYVYIVKKYIADNAERGFGSFDIEDNAEGALRFVWWDLNAAGVASIGSVLEFPIGRENVEAIVKANNI